MFRKLAARMRRTGVHPLIADEMETLCASLEDLRSRGGPGSLENLVTSSVWKDGFRTFLQQQAKAYTGDLLYEAELPPQGHVREILKELELLGVEVVYEGKMRIDFPPRPSAGLLRQKVCLFEQRGSLNDRELEKLYQKRNTEPTNPFTLMALNLHALRGRITPPLQFPQCTQWRAGPLNFNSLIVRRRNGKISVTLYPTTQERVMGCRYAESSPS